MWVNPDDPLAQHAASSGSYTRCLLTHATVPPHQSSCLILHAMPFHTHVLITCLEQHPQQPACRGSCMDLTACSWPAVASWLSRGCLTSNARHASMHPRAHPRAPCAYAYVLESCANLTGCWALRHAPSASAGIPTHTCILSYAAWPSGWRRLQLPTLHAPPARC